MNATTVIQLLSSAIEHKSLSLADKAKAAMEEFLSKARVFRESDRQRVPKGERGPHGERPGSWTAGGAAVGYAWEITKPAVTETVQVWVKDKVTGRRRKKDRVRVLEKSEGRWVDEYGKPIPKKIHTKLEELKVPKSLIGVKINPGSGKTAAIGYMYNRNTGEIRDNYTAIRHASAIEATYKAKWEALDRFEKVKKILEPKAYEDAMNGDSKAAALFVIDRMGIRVGSGRENKRTGVTKEGVDTYGCVDLLAKHVKVQGKLVSFKFMEKGGKLYDRSIVDSKLASVIRVALTTKDGRDKKANDRLFPTTDQSVRSYMKAKGGPLTKKFKMTPHSYRYWWATAFAKAAIRESKPPYTKEDADRIKKRACKAAGDFLNDDPATVYETYINPALWMDWDEDIRPALPKDMGSKSYKPSLTPYRAAKLMEDMEYDILWPDMDYEVDMDDDELLPDPDTVESTGAWKRDVES